jgi:4-carboxymuconolactone decarboxylase
VGEEGSPENDVARFAGLLLTNGYVDDDAFAAVEAHLGLPAALELTVTVGYYCLIAFVLNVDRYPLPPGAEPAFETPADVGEVD